MTRTTVLLLSVDEGAMLARSLPCALAQDGAEVVVVDNASTDSTAQLARDAGARVLRLDARRSYAAAINEAVWVTGGDAVLLLNADCFLEPGFLAAARPRLDEPGVGSVAPKLLREGADEIDAAGMFVDRRRKNGLVGHGRAASLYSVRGEAFGADGAAALYRRETLEECALGREILDEDMALWASDADLAWRARLLGWRCVYEPQAVAHHVRTYSPSTRSAVAEAHRALQFRNRLLMMVKNETPRGFARDAPWIVSYEVLALGHAVLRERFLLGAYRDVWRGLPAARRRRAVVQARRVVARPSFGVAPFRG